ncbi:PREDICTED: chaoptin-like [Ceratosolen solmsi marchali]|uniref:Chaoptin-like n=1 Tax=Ceratosolen solmsi marchali TaxID=326594 RepID=A0AAJ6YHJ9_9HYME|nr:PREDICTED: chaoptin-like [Ceratosolen solmsi marchali]
MCVYIDSAVLPSTAHCPPVNTLQGCPCYNFANGLFLECTGSTEETLKNALARIFNQAKPYDLYIIDAVIQSLNIYELDRKVEEFRNNIFSDDFLIRHIQISHSGLRGVTEDAFKKISHSLESLAIVFGELSNVPQKAIVPLKQLEILDLEANLIHDLPSFSFYGLSLRKLNIKGNRIIKISEYAFAGLEDTLTDLNLAENKIRVFPMTALRRLESLAVLTLAWNEISQLPEDGYSRLDNLSFLDLSSNNFFIIPLNCFRCCPSVQTLSMYYNSIESVDKDAFISLISLESIDLSHNKIIFLDISTFRANQKLRSIDLSYNHIHYIRSVFARLPELKELFLVENNILEIPAYAFSGSVSLSVIYLQQNAIRRINPLGLSSLQQLTQLHLSSNYIQYIPRDFLQTCENLSTLSLDENQIRELEIGTFAKTKQLRELRLQDNLIREIKRGVFTPLSSLIELHLQNNAITDIETGAFRSLHNLEHVNLQGNLLAVLGDVFQVSESIGSGTRSLISFQLDNNGLGVLHNDSLKDQTSIRIMWLGHNRLTRLQAQLFRDLFLVERLYLTSNSITKIEDTAFQPMKALKFLDLSLNKLTHITVKTFSDLQELEELYLTDNGLRNLDAYALISLKRLRVLDLSNNWLSGLHDTIFQEGLPIRSLNLHNCSIAIIDTSAFRGLNNLYELNLDHNHLAADILHNLIIPGLRILRISYNNFSRLKSESFDGLPSLQHLSIESSKIYKIPLNSFSRNKNLVKILLRKNELKSLPPFIFFGLDSLKEINLDDNYFQEIPYNVFINASSIESLSLARNIIFLVDISRLHGLINLQELDLRENKIKLLTGFSEAKLIKLTFIDLSYNYLTSLPENFFINSNVLRKVDLAGNKLHQIPTIALSAQNIPSLDWLNVTANPLMRIHEISSKSKYPALQEIHISRTNLTIVATHDFEAFSELLHLFINSNMIYRISPDAFSYLPKLLTLDLSINKLEVLPQECLKGLEHLRLLNLTYNRLQELEDFPSDLKTLQVLDVSFNQINQIRETTFQYLENLSELYILGNQISNIAVDAFKCLVKLRILDLSKNYLKSLPVNAFRPLETQIQSLLTEENPLHCNCESQELWEWLRDHQKLIRSSSSDGGDRESDNNHIRNQHSNGINTNYITGFLRCDQPPELRGLVFLDLEPRKFCSAPVIPKVSIQDIQPYSILVSWQSRNYSGVHGYEVIFYALDNSDEIHSTILEATSRSVRLTKLLANTRYRVCVMGLSNWMNSQILVKDDEIIKDLHQPFFNDSHNNFSIKKSILSNSLDTSISHCTETLTLDIQDAISRIDDSSLSSNNASENINNSILTRRLGLIIGCCMGFIVFIVLITILGYLKVKKQREAAKRDQQVMPPEYISYRHFSVEMACQAARHIQPTVNLDGQV